MDRHRGMPFAARVYWVVGLVACSGGPTGAPPPPPPVFPAPVPGPTTPPSLAPGPGPTTPPSPAPSPPPVFGPPPTFADAELARRVEQLATFDRVESSHVGAAGAPSAAFAAFTAVRERATPGDLLALLRHPRPVVRAYVAQHLVREVPGELPAAMTLLEDPTPVGQLEGCMMSTSTVGGIVADAVCFSRQPAAIAEVARLARADGPRSAWAMACIGQSDRAQAGALALDRLQTRAVQGDERAGLLRLVGNAALGPAGCAALLAATRAPETDVRVAAAQGLAECPEPEAIAALRRLATEPDATLQRIATTELVLHVSMPSAEREALLADAGVATRASVQLSFRMGRFGLDRYAERYRAIAIAHPTLSWNGVASQPPSDGALTLARAVAAAVPVGTNARRDAIGQLARNGDARDLPELRRSLEGDDVSELIAALEAIGRLRDGASRGAVQRLVGHVNPSVGRAATAALGHL